MLARYAELSGGAAFTRERLRAACKSAADRIVGELKHQYRLGYDPPPGPARFRRVEVATTRKGVVGHDPQRLRAAVVSRHTSRAGLATDHISNGGLR